MVDLGVEIAGLKLKNPFVIGSGPMACDVYRIVGNMDRIVAGGWSGVILKSLGNDVKMVQELNGAYPHIFPVRGGRGRLLGFQNYGPTTSLIADADLKGVLKAGREKGLVIIPSVQAADIEDFVALVKAVEKSGAEAVEVNFACPMDPEKVTGGEAAQFDSNPRLAEETVKAIKSESTMSIIVKLGPNLTDVAPVARAVERGGADAISAVNCLLGFSGLDIRAGGLPLSASGNRKTILSGLSGEVLRPIALRSVAQIARAVKIPVFGIGGITTWQSAVEHLMLGATALQVCTAVMERGFPIGTGFVENLTKFMQQNGYSRLDDLRGLALRHITDDFYQLNQEKLVASVDMEKCNLCGLCVTACADGTAGAIKIDGNECLVYQELCESCGLCRVVCPQDAIEFVERV